MSHRHFIFVTVLSILIPGVAALAADQDLNLIVYRREMKVPSSQPASVAVEFLNRGKIPARFRLVTMVRSEPFAPAKPAEPGAMSLEDALDAQKTYGLFFNIYVLGNTPQNQGRINIAPHPIQMRSMTIEPGESAFVKIEIPAKKLGIGRCMLQATFMSGEQVLARSEAVPLEVLEAGKGE